MRLRKKTGCFLLLLSVLMAILPLSACTVSRKFLRGKKQGLYPDPSDFPNTKWDCDGVEMTLWFLDGGEKTAIGTYTEDGTAYRLTAVFSSIGPYLDFTVSSAVEVSEGSYQDSTGQNYPHCERRILGTVGTTYIYRQEELICTVQTSDLAQFPKDRQLIFRQDHDYSLTVQTRYTCPELKAEIEAFAEIDGYYKGTIELNGQVCGFQLFEIGNQDYYIGTIENGITNNDKTGTTSDLVRMILSQTDQGLTASVTDDVLLQPLLYPEWKQTNAVFHFEKIPATTSAEPPRRS